MPLVTQNEILPAFQAVPWVVFFPLLGLILNLLFGKRFGEKFAGAVASLATLASFGVALTLFFALQSHPEGASVPFLTWIQVGDFVVNWAFRVDTLSVTMMLVVSGVGLLIHIYAAGYMHEDVRHNGDPGRYRRFFVYFNLFIAMMMILVSADNYLMLFVGWEGVGLCSYLLIGFWFEKGKDGIANAQAAKKAFVVNRVGDFGLLIALFLMYQHFGTLEFAGVFEQAPALAAATPGVLLAMTLFMLLGVTGKSAQIPLYVWLPDAMAGPTPVSALIHAATMVTAGVYLVVRSTPLYSLVPEAQTVVTWVGALTALFAATIAIAQFDIKRVLAYSTISQLGFMVAAAGMGAGVAAMFHLTTHAFFKALLFLAAGSVILGVEAGHARAHAHADEHGHDDFDPQDMRNMGGLKDRMPLTFWVYLTGALALSGIAPLSGFFSKDEILHVAEKNNLAVFWLLLATAFLTAFYMGRQLVMVFGGTVRTRAAGAARENGAIITLPLVGLAVLSVLGGLLNFPGSWGLEHWLEHTLEGIKPSEFAPLTALISVLVALGGLGLAYAIYAVTNPLSDAKQPDPLTRLGVLWRGMANKWKVDELYHALFVRPYEALARFLATPVDQGVIDGISGGLAWLSVRAGEGLRVLQNGFLRSYALLIVLGVAAILSYLIWVR
ncbi:NADH-quinone oxidoreductase subunit L [Anaerolinea sp.]|uniref:NADH-quinone oxidoreductase subunit L n=1 Tax=Anaerolinea sp. TaxID=1872519 RepID=UPI002ACDC278|nr:NADH-quinone oxidoreductase subunit L [Anaerolinea sp.]